MSQEHVDKVLLKRLFKAMLGLYYEGNRVSSVVNVLLRKKTFSEYRDIVEISMLRDEAAEPYLDRIDVFLQEHFGTLGNARRTLLNSCEKKECRMRVLGKALKDGLKRRSVRASSTRAEMDKYSGFVRARLLDARGGGRGVCRHVQLGGASSDEPAQGRLVLWTLAGHAGHEAVHRRVDGPEIQKHCLLQDTKRQVDDKSSEIYSGDAVDFVSSFLHRLKDYRDTRSNKCKNASTKIFDFHTDPKDHVKWAGHVVKVLGEAEYVSSLSQSQFEALDAHLRLSFRDTWLNEFWIVDSISDPKSLAFFCEHLAAWVHFQGDRSKVHQKFDKSCPSPQDRVWMAKQYFAQAVEESNACRFCCVLSSFVPTHDKEDCPGKTFPDYNFWENYKANKLLELVGQFFEQAKKEAQKAEEKSKGPLDRQTASTWRRCRPPTSRAARDPRFRRVGERRSAGSMDSPKHGKHDVVPDEVQAAYASYESSHGKALPAGSRIETKDAVYVVEDEARRSRPAHSPKQPKSSVSQSVQSKFSAIDRQIKSGRKGPTQVGAPAHAGHAHAAGSAPVHAPGNAPAHSPAHSPVQGHSVQGHSPVHSPVQGHAGHTAPSAQVHPGHQAVHHPADAKSPSRSLAGNVRDHHNVHQIGKDRFHDKLVDKHEALQKQRADALAADAKSEQIVGGGAVGGAAGLPATTGVASAPASASATGASTTAPASAAAPTSGAAGASTSGATSGATSNPTSPRPSPKKRESWGNKFNAFKNRDKDAEPKAEKEDKPSGIRGFFSGLTKRKDKAEDKADAREERVLADAAQSQDQEFGTGAKEVPNMSGFRDTQLPELEQSVRDGRPDEYDTSTFAGAAQAGIASVVGAVGLGSDGAQPEPAHGFAAARNAASGGHEFAGERVLAEARAQSEAEPLGEVPGANAKVGATGLPVQDEFGVVKPEDKPQPKDFKLGNEVFSKLRSGQAGVGIVPDYKKNVEAENADKNTPQGILAQDAQLDDTLPHKSKLDASGLPLKQYADRDVGKLEDATQLSSPSYAPNFAQDEKLDPSLPHPSKLNAAGFANTPQSDNAVSGDFNLKADQIAGDVTKVGNDPRFAHAQGQTIKPEHELAIEDGPRTLDPGSAVSGDFNLKANQIAGDVTKVGNDPRFAHGTSEVIKPKHELAIGDGPATGSSGNAVSGDFNLKANQIADDVTKVGNDPRFASSSKPELEITDPGHFKPATGAFNLGSNEIADDVTKVGNDPRFAHGASEEIKPKHELAIGDGPSTGVPAAGNAVSGDFNLKANQIVDDVTKVGSDPRFAAGSGSGAHPTRELEITDGPSSTGGPAAGGAVSGDFNLKANQIAGDVTKVGNDPRFASGASSASKPAHELEITDPGHFKPATGAFNLGSNEIAGDVTKVGNDPRFASSKPAHELEITDPGHFKPATGDFNLKSGQIADDVTKVGNDPRFASGSASSSKPTHELEITDPGHFKPATGAFNLGSNEIADDVTKVGNDPRFVKTETGVIHPEHELAIGDGPSTGAPAAGNAVSGDFNLKANQIVDDKTKVGNDPRFASDSTSKPAHELEITDPGHFKPATGAFNLGSNEIADDVTKVGNDPRFASGSSSKPAHELEITDPGHFKPATGDFNLKSGQIADDITKVGNDPRFASSSSSKPAHELEITDPGHFKPATGDFNLKSGQIADDVTKVGNDPRFAHGSSSGSKPAHELEITDPGHFKPATGDFNLKSGQIADDVTKVGNDPRFAHGSSSGSKPAHELEITDPGHFKPATGDFNLKSDQIADDVTKIGNDPRFVKSETGVIKPEHELDITDGSGPSSKIPGAFGAVSGEPEGQPAR
ncbi:hypothetical protein CJU89_6138 [Yarrowia sp. B02]|nr:hypothetical protein CJU89_6138 [Yarrowia sp. B02]